MANGRVCTGFSKPYVATYAIQSGAVKYSDAQILARGVNVSITPESGSDNIFYADNQAAETAGAGTFTGGTVSLTVDGLKPAAEKLIMGLPEAGTDGWISYDDEQTVPYVGIGFIARYMEGGVASYVPYVLAKASFSQVETSAATQEENISFQTQTLSAQLFRADDTNHTWKYVGAPVATETLAETALRKKLGLTA